MASTAWDAIIGSMTIRQVESSGASANAKVTMGRASAGLNAEAIYLDSAEPTISITSSDLLTILGGIGLNTGLCISSGTITLPFAKNGCAGTLGNGNHTVISATNGFAVIQSISGGTDGAAAKATVELCLLSTDGKTLPYSTVANGNLASTAFIGEYRMNKVTVNGTQVTGLQNVTVNPDTNYTKEMQDGGIYPTFTLMADINPTINLTFKNEAAYAAFGPLFADNTALIVYFQKKADGSSVVAPETTGHIAFSFGDNMSISEGIRGQGRNSAEVTVKVYGKTLAVATTSAIP